MKKKKRIICAVLVMIMSLFAQTNLVIEAASVLEVEEYARVVFMERQGESNEAYTRLKESFANDNGGYSYPDTYAGAYINAQGYLVILTTGESEQEKNDMLEVCNNNSVLIAMANYSFNELTAIKELVSARAKYAIEEKKFNCNGYSVSIRDKENKVFIGVEDTANSELIEFLVEGLAGASYEVVKFNIPEDYVDTRPGDYLDVGGGGSAACGAQYTENGVTHIGFLTAAHVTNSDTTCYVKGEHVGTTIWEQNGGEFDVAFIELIGNHTFTSIVDEGYVKSMSYITPASGSIVYKKGYATGKSSGTVISGSYDFTSYSSGEWRSYTNMIQVDDSNAAAGDSGCLVYMIHNSEVYAVGILKGGDGSTYCATKVSALTTQRIVPIQ